MHGMTVVGPLFSQAWLDILLLKIMALHMSLIVQLISHAYSTFFSRIKLVMSPFTAVDEQ